MIRLRLFDHNGKEIDRAQRLQPGTVPAIADILHASLDGVHPIVEDVTIHYKGGTKAVYTAVNERERRAPLAG